MAEEVESLTALEHKVIGNSAFVKGDLVLAEYHYTLAIMKLPSDHIVDPVMEVTLYSNRSLVRLQLNRPQEALKDANYCIALDPTFEKGYMRCAAAMEALNLGQNSIECPIYKTMLRGLMIVPGSSILYEALATTYPWLKSKTCSQVKKILSSKKRRNSPCNTTFIEPIDIRGAFGPNEIKINGVYYPVDPLLWDADLKCVPVYRKKYTTIDSDDQYDDYIIEYSRVKEVWHIVHVSQKGMHSNSSYAYLSQSHKNIIPPLYSTGQWFSRSACTNGNKSFILLSLMTLLSVADRRKADAATLAVSRPLCKPLEIRGGRIVGTRQIIDGIYTVTDQSHGGWPIYCRHDVTRDDSSNELCIEYNPYHKCWQVKPFHCLGGNDSLAYLLLPHNTVSPPDQCKVWFELWKDETFHAGDEVCALTLQKWNEYDTISKASWANVKSIAIQNATGVFANIINGVFDARSTFDLGYYKRPSESTYTTTTSIKYSYAKKQWQVNTPSGCCAFIPDESISTLDKASNETWSVSCDGQWESQPSVCVLLEADMIEADKGKCLKVYVDAIPVEIRGCVGPNSALINGVFEPTLQTHCGLPVYVKKGTVNMRMIYNDRKSLWQFNIGRDIDVEHAYACVDSGPVAKPELCTGLFYINDCDNGSWRSQPLVSMRSANHFYEQDLELSETRRELCAPIKVIGGHAIDSVDISGTYVPVLTRTMGGWPTYQKKDDPDWWIEYDACSNKWMLRPTLSQGTTKGIAYVIIQSDVPLHLATGLWRVSDHHGGWIVDNSISIEAVDKSVVKVATSSSKLAPIQSYAPMIVSNVPSCMIVLQGIYDFTGESYNSLPTYKKRGSNGISEIWAEYSVTASEWQLKPVWCRGSDTKWGYVSCIEIKVIDNWNGLHICMPSDTNMLNLLNIMNAQR